MSIAFQTGALYDTSLGYVLFWLVLKDVLCLTRVACRFLCWCRPDSLTDFIQEKEFLVIGLAISDFNARGFAEMFGRTG